MRRFRKRFKRPKRPYDAVQIKEGKALEKKFGLRRKKEIWIAEEIVRSLRQRTRELIAVKNPGEEKVLLERVKKLGLLGGDAGLDDILGLTVEHILERRLQTMVFKKGMAKTIRQARQSIVHGHVMVGGRKVVFPSYLVDAGKEGQIISSFTPPEPLAKAGDAAKPEEATESTEEL